MNIQRLIGLYCLAFLLAGCSNWLDVQPYDQISEDELVKSEEGFQKALNGIYIGLNDEALYGKSLTVEMIEIMGAPTKSATKAWYGELHGLKRL